LHAHVHALPGFWAARCQLVACSNSYLLTRTHLPVSMHRITCQEDPLAQRELVAHALSDLVRRPPVTVPISKLVRAQNPLRRSKNHIRVDRRTIDFLPARLVRRRELDVQSHQPVLARDDHQTAGLCAMDGTSHPDIWEIRDRDDVQYAPDIVCRVALEFEAEPVAHPGARAVAAHHVLGVYGLDGAGFVAKLSGREQFCCVVGCQVRSEQTVLHRGSIRRCGCGFGRGFFFRQVAKRNRDSIRIVVISSALVKLHALR